VSSFYVPIILERKDAVVPALIGKQRECDNEQPLGYVKSSRLHILLLPPLTILLENLRLLPVCEFLLHIIFISFVKLL